MSIPRGSVSVGPACATLAWLVVGVTGCSSSTEPGVSLLLLSSVTPVVPEAVFMAAPGSEVRVSVASWTNASVEIGACPSLGARVLDLIVPSARAHGIAAPTRSAEPVIQSVSLDASVELGVLAPPAGVYCTATYSLGPADSDAVGLDGAPDMLGLSIRVAGTYRRDGGPWEEFDIETAGEISAYRTDVSLDLTRPGASAVLRVAHDISAWFGGIDFGSDAASSREQRLLDNIEAAIHFDVEWPNP